ncbi:MAG: hypothetical protein ACKOC8_10595 [Pirellulales bacterium]
MAVALSDVRLTPAERDGIRRAVSQACAEMGIAWRRIVLFGSRADPLRRGGDIDLLIEIAPTGSGGVQRLTQRLRLALEDELGEQRIDLVLDDGHAGGAFSAVARATGVELWSNN